MQEKKTGYKTKQRDCLLAYLKTMQGKHVTVSEICRHLNDQEISIGQTTVYRHLSKLISEGVVNKYVIDANTPACFEYISTEEHCSNEVCFHCKCEKCGRLIHMHCDELEAISDHLLKEHSFALDPMRTVFYGLCSDCRKEDHR